VPITRERDPDDASPLSAPPTQPIPLPIMSDAAPDGVAPDPVRDAAPKVTPDVEPDAEGREPERGPLAVYGPPGFPLVTPFPEFPDTPEPDPEPRPGGGHDVQHVAAGASVTTPALAPLRPSGWAARLRRVAGACAGLAAVGIVVAAGIAASTPQRVVLLTGDTGQDTGQAGAPQVTVVPLRAVRPQAAAGLRVQAVEAAVRPADLPGGCPAAAVVVRTPPVPLDVPAGPAEGGLEVPVSVELHGEDVPACRRGALHVDGVLTVVDTTGRVRRLPAGGVLAPAG